MARIVPIVLAVALWIYAIIDCARTDRSLMPGRLSKGAWLALVIVLPVIGSALWLWLSWQIKHPAGTGSGTVVDVVAKLEELAAKNPEKLKWKVTIVDLLKLLGLDSSLGARKELASELGCPAEKMGDSAQMNMWLHKTVLQKLADNGGNVPAELLD